MQAEQAEDFFLRQPQPRRGCVRKDRVEQLALIALSCTGRAAGDGLFLGMLRLTMTGPPGEQFTTSTFMAGIPHHGATTSDALSSSSGGHLVIVGV